MVNEKLVKQAIKKGISEIFPDGLKSNDRRFKDYLKECFVKITDSDLQDYLDDKKRLEYDFCGNYFLVDNGDN